MNEVVARGDLGGDSASVDILLKTRNCRPGGIGICENDAYQADGTV